MMVSEDKSGSLRYLIIVVAFFSSFLGGVIFAWPSIQVVLEESGQYSSLSKDDRDAQFVLISQIGFAALQAARLLFGFVLDRFGPRAATAAAGTSTLLGALLFSLSDTENGIDLFLPGFLLLGIGSPGIHVSNFHSSNLFPKAQGTVMNLFSAGYTFGGLWGILFFSLFKEQDITFQQLFAGYTVFAGVILFANVSLQPSTSHPMGAIPHFDFYHWRTRVELPEDHSSTTDDQVEVSCSDESEKESSTREELLRMSTWNQLLSKDGVYLATFFCVVWLNVTFFLSSVKDQLERNRSEDGASTYANLFTIIAALGGFFTPVSGFLMDAYKDGAAYGFILLVVLFLFKHLLSFVSTAGPALITGFISWSCARILLFGIYFPLVGRIFGFKSFGRIVGIHAICAAAIGTASIGFSSVTLNQLDGNFNYINALLSVLLVLSLAYPVLFLRHRYF